MDYIAFILIIISDRAFQGTRKDETIPKIRSWCTSSDFILDRGIIIPDDIEAIKTELFNSVKNDNAQLIITSGGTGFSLTDVTPEVTREVIEKRVPGIDEYLRTKGLEKTPYAVLSRGISGIIKNKLIINLPGNPEAVIESMDWLKPILPHALSLLQGQKDDSAHKFKNGK